MAKTIERLDGLRMAIAGGFVLGFGIFFLTVIAAGTGYGVATLDILRFYPGYTVTYAGSAVGFLWGFVDGFISLGFLAWVYNHLHLGRDK